MGKRGVINPTYGMTNSAFFGKFRSMLRKEWSYSKPYRDALKRAKVAFNEPGQRKFSERCEQCGIECKLNEQILIGETKKGEPKYTKAYVVHHIIECGAFNSFKDMGGFAERLNCPPEDLLVLCYNCHQKAHGKEGVK